MEVFSEENVSYEMEKMADEYVNNSSFRAVIDYFALREREPRNSETKVGNLKLALRSVGDFSVEEIVDVLKKLAQCGCGPIHNGRPKEKTRLQWNVSAINTAKAVKRSVQHEKGDLINEKEIVQNAQDFESYPFPVRPEVTMPLRLYKDLTRDQLINLSDYIKVIANSRHP